jgi:hypothetical protein
LWTAALDATIEMWGSISTRELSKRVTLSATFVLGKTVDGDFFRPAASELDEGELGELDCVRMRANTVAIVQWTNTRRGSRCIK